MESILCETPIGLPTYYEVSQNWDPPGRFVPFGLWDSPYIVTKGIGLVSQQPAHPLQESGPKQMAEI